MILSFFLPSRSIEARAEVGIGLLPQKSGAEVGEVGTGLLLPLLLLFLLLGGFLRPPARALEGPRRAQEGHRKSVGRARGDVQEAH